MADDKKDDSVPSRPTQIPPLQKRDDQPGQFNDQNPLEGQSLITITRSNEAEKADKKSG